MCSPGLLPRAPKTLIWIFPKNFASVFSLVWADEGLTGCDFFIEVPKFDAKGIILGCKDGFLVPSAESWFVHVDVDISLAMGAYCPDNAGGGA